MAGSKIASELEAINLLQLSSDASAARYQGGMARMRSRITFTRLSPGADRGRAGSSPAERGKRAPRARTGRAAPPAIQKSAMFTQMRAETPFRCITSVCVPFYARVPFAFTPQLRFNWHFISVIRIAVTSEAPSRDALIKLMKYIINSLPRCHVLPSNCRKIIMATNSLHKLW